MVAVAVTIAKRIVWRGRQISGSCLSFGLAVSGADSLPSMGCARLRFAAMATGQPERPSSYRNRPGSTLQISLGSLWAIVGRCLSHAAQRAFTGGIAREY